jgi:hypothetical protein
MQLKTLLLARGFAIAALALCVGGCSNPRFDVTGQVKYNGKVLAKPNGQIVFVGPDGTQAGASIAEDGTYTATGVAAGPNRVAVYYPNPDFKKIARPKGKPDASQRPPTQAQYLTPEKYVSVDTSELKVDVAQGTVFNVELKGPAIR